MLNPKNQRVDKRLQGLDKQFARAVLILAPTLLGLLSREQSPENFIRAGFVSTFIVGVFTYTYLQIRNNIESAPNRTQNSTSVPQRLLPPADSDSETSEKTADPQDNLPQFQ